MDSVWSSYAPMPPIVTKAISPRPIGTKKMVRDTGQACPADRSFQTP